MSDDFDFPTPEELHRSRMRSLELRRVRAIEEQTRLMRQEAKPPKTPKQRNRVVGFVELLHAANELRAKDVPEHEFTQERLAEQAGVSVDTVQRVLGPEGWRELKLLY